MDVTTMPSMHSLIKQLVRSFPELNFQSGDQYMWSPSTRTVIFYDNEPNPAQLLHELGHGLLGHDDYSKDIGLLSMERDAWEEAKKIGETFKVLISDETIEDYLDTYREWLHARSTCPNCTAIGVQVKRAHYRCVACSHEWRVNDARVCQLKRYSINTKTR